MIDPGVAAHVASGLAHHRAGRLDLAAREYEAALALRPDDGDGLHYLGVVAHQKADRTRALELLGRAAKANPKVAQVFCNLAEAQRAAGKPQEAEQSARRALELKPGYPEAQVNLGAALFAQRRFNDAEVSAREALASRPDSREASLLLADSLREQHKAADAEAQYRRILAAFPDDEAALANLGLMLVQSGRMDDGYELCRRAAELAPESLLSLQNLGRVMLEFGRLDEAMDAFERAFQRAPDSPILSFLIGVAWQEMGEGVEARNWFKRSLDLDPELVDAQVRIAQLEIERDEAESAGRILDAMVAKHPDRPDVLAARARARVALGDVDDALADYRAALALRPDAAMLHASLGGVLASAGDIEGGVVEQRKAIEINPRCVPAYSGILAAIRHRATDAERDAARALLEAPWMTDGRRASLHLGLAAYYDGKREYREAAAHMVKGNALAKAADQRRYLAYEPEEYEGLVDQVIETFTPALFSRLANAGSQSERPVFVVGMPRSGTTLLEQIVASHPAAFGAGERRFAQRGLIRLSRAMGVPNQDGLASVAQAGPADIEAAARWHLGQLDALDGGKALRIVDKMPDNYSLLGWLAIVFPRARFIYSRRDFRDIALSCWITNFGEIGWASDLDHIAHRIEQHRRLMAHWRKVLPVPLLEVDYEGMVADQEDQSRRVIEFLGLPWDSRCLAFHKTQRMVRTASIAQVREPMYNRSVARWTHYEEMLAPLIRRLGLDRATT